MAHRGLMVFMLLLAVANCQQWVYTLTDESLAQDIFQGFNGKGKDLQVECGPDKQLTCGQWTTKKFIIEDFESRQWESKFQSTIAGILNECTATVNCRAVNFDWVAICSSPGLDVGGGLIDCLQSGDGDYVGIAIAYQLLSPRGSSYSINLASSTNFLASNFGKALCTELWEKASLPQVGLWEDTMYQQYKDNKRMHQLYDFVITGTNPLQPSCSSKVDGTCPTAPGSFAPVNNWLSSSEDCKAQDFGKMAGLGYNIVMGSPMAQIDEGYKASPIFKPSGGFETIESGQMQDGCPLWKFKYPKGYSVQNLNMLSAVTSTGSMYSEQSYQQSSMSRVSASVQGSYLGASAGFTGSADFKSFSQSVQKQKMVEIRQFQEAPAFASSVQLFDLEFSDDYLKSLAAAYKSNGDFSAFIESYGTHLTTSVRAGARFSQVSLFTSDNYETLKSNGEAFEMGMTASYAGVSGKADAKNEKTQEAKAAFEGKRESMKLLSVGANHEPIDFSKGGKDEYIRLAHQFPEVLSSSVFPHSKLIQQRWDDIAKAIPDVDQAKFFEYYGQFMGDYCAALPSKCMANPADPPKPMTLDWDMPIDSEMVGSTDCSKYPCKEIKFKPVEDFQVLRDSVTISKIQMQCREFGQLGMRVAAMKFHLTDFTTDIELISLGNRDTSKDWDVDETLEVTERVISVQIRGGVDVDYIQFSIKNKDGKIREVHCGGNGGTEVAPISLAGFQLLDYAGYQDVNSGYIRALQFRKFKTEFKSKSAIAQFQSKKQAENQQFYQSLLADGRAMAESHSLQSPHLPVQPTGWDSSAQNLQAKGHAHGMWEKIENFEEKFLRVEETVGKIVDALHKIEQCADASKSPSSAHGSNSPPSSYSRSPNRQASSSHQTTWA